ncbi:MAG: site-2 protease family protein [Burkholderiales bacterium]|nr:site-2 protease family protein [Burkholderiales bacterium]MDE2431608.1 site-2 protease family protein [Burkholderiales bacterium]HET8693111.1 site-2 protease family protein [Aquabacterium sp.]
MLKLLFLLFSGLKFGKLFTTGGTMLISILVYAWIYGWRYAVGFVGLLFVHEMGHFIAARQRGLPVGAPTFIPFVGAWIELKQMPHDAETEAYVGMAGPLVGSLGALACYFLARDMSQGQWLLAVSYAGFMLNLFNLIPVSPLDGGRITAVLSPRLWLLGVPVLLGLFWWHPSPILIMVAILAAPQVMKAWHFKADDPAHAAYYQASAETRLTYATAYVGLIIFLALMSHDVHEMLVGATSS